METAGPLDQFSQRGSFTGEASGRLGKVEIVLGLQEMAILGSSNGLGAYGLARKLAGPLMIR
jgi:hypothetical protein